MTATSVKAGRGGELGVKKNLREKAMNTWLSILEFVDSLIGEGPGFLVSGIVSLLTVLAVLRLTGRL